MTEEVGGGGGTEKILQDAAFPPAGHKAGSGGFWRDAGPDQEKQTDPSTPSQEEAKAMPAAGGEHP